MWFSVNGVAGEVFQYSVQKTIQAGAEEPRPRNMIGRYGRWQRSFTNGRPIVPARLSASVNSGARARRCARAAGGRRNTSLERYRRFTHASCPVGSNRFTCSAA